MRRKMTTTILNDNNLCSVIQRFNEATREGVPLICKHVCNTSVNTSGAQKLVCFTPKNATGTMSLLKTVSGTKKTITTDANLAIVPANAIIDKIEFFGINGFATKNTFSIGLGQLNDVIMLPLIENTDASIANERVGGCRQFSSSASNGKNTQTITIFQTYVNIVLDQPITAGSLQVVVYYHIKPGTE
jgi:hypothetical protein